jgi:oligoendopeptidase F
MATARTKRTASKKAKAAPIPVWDLKDLYPSMRHASVTRDLNKLTKNADKFARDYHGNIKKLDGGALAKAIKEYEALQDIAGRLASYAQLLYASDMTDPAIAQFYQNTHETLTRESAKLIFLSLELNGISDAALTRMMKASKPLAHYAPWLAQVRAYKPYQLPAALESYVHQQSVVQQSWQRLFDETIARMRFDYKGKSLTEPEMLDKLSSKDAKERKEAAKIIGKVFAEHAPTFTLITNTLAKAKEIEDTARGYAKPISSRNVSNQVEDEVVDALITTVKKNYADLSHRYYAWKAKQFGKKAIDYWDRNAPLPNAKDSHIPWEKGVEIVRKAYHAFSPKLASIGDRFFDNDWIDVPTRPGKASGAFAHPTVPSAHPYLLLNYQGKTRDVMTLAHELGHGVHQVLAAKQGALMCDTPLTLAETASVFGEMLTFQSMLSAQKNKQQRQFMIASKVEDMLNTVVRQVAFCEFERSLHDARKKGELTSEDIGKLWMKIQHESLGPAIKLHPEYAHYWMYIPHFIHSPFYVYAYAFGDCLVNSLYGVYLQKQEKGEGDAFVKQYFEMLSAGGSLGHKELLAPFGLDASKPRFWQQGLNVIKDYIAQLDD